MLQKKHRDKKKYIYIIEECSMQVCECVSFAFLISMFLLQYSYVFIAFLKINYRVLKGFPNQMINFLRFFPPSEVSPKVVIFLVFFLPLKCLNTWTSFATLPLPNLFLSLVSAILLNSRSMPALKGGHDAIDIIKVEKHTESHRPPNIYVAIVWFQ